ncbi:hypothetical protein ACFQNF_09850 [Iodobacter arcticus]|uniref:Uncharacterized protein n=1 Tax=Iodobacter arcticus TaxID=590593 RepID=A0ABW2R202_9NEIS
MVDTINWRALQAEGQTYAERQITEAAAQDSISRDFYGAALIAMRSTQQDELHPVIGEFGQTRYTTQQGLKAACHAREDVMAVLIIQQAVLRRLQGIRIMAWVCLAILCYIAVRIS